MSDTKSGAAARQFRMRRRVGSATVRRRSAAEPEIAEVVIFAQTNIRKMFLNGSAASLVCHQPVRRTLCPFRLYNDCLYYERMHPLLIALAIAAAPLQDTAHVVLVATTDVHGHATDWDYVRQQSYPGGLTRVATIVDSLKALYPGAVVVMDAGDVTQGNAFAAYFARVKPHDPHPIIEAMNLAGYDVATPGN